MKSVKIITQMIMTDVLLIAKQKTLSTSPKLLMEMVSQLTHRYTVMVIEREMRNVMTETRLRMTVVLT